MGYNIVCPSCRENNIIQSSAFTTDLSGVIPDADYGNIIFVSEVGPTGLTRTDIIGDINKPVNLDWASTIVLSGDTIHVKAGIYTVTTTAANGLSVSGVNHYFEENSLVYKTTSGAMFYKANLIGFFDSGGNVYGNGSFYGSGSCGEIYRVGPSFGSGTKPGYDGFFSDPSVFEFDSPATQYTPGPDM